MPYSTPTVTSAIHFLLRTKYFVSYIDDDEKLLETTWRNDRYSYCCSAGDFPLLLHCVQLSMICRFSDGFPADFAFEDDVLRIRRRSTSYSKYFAVYFVRRSTVLSKTKHFTLEDEALYSRSTFEHKITHRSFIQHFNTSLPKHQSKCPGKELRYAG